jgi:hypothetical protein
MNTGDSEVIRPFTINVRETELDDLRKRLAKARWAVEPVEGAEAYGVSRSLMHELWSTGAARTTGACGRTG